MRNLVRLLPRQVCEHHFRSKKPTACIEKRGVLGMTFAPGMETPFLPSKERVVAAARRLIGA
jgi:hypothetical protein